MYCHLYYGLYSCWIQVIRSKKHHGYCDCWNPSKTVIFPSKFIRKINLPNSSWGYSLAVIQNDIVQFFHWICSQDFTEQLVRQSVNLVEEKEVQVCKEQKLFEGVHAQRVLKRVVAAPTVVAVPKFKFVKFAKQTWNQLVMEILNLVIVISHKK